MIRISLTGIIQMTRALCALRRRRRRQEAAQPVGEGGEAGRGRHHGVADGGAAGGRARRRHQGDAKIPTVLIGTRWRSCGSVASWMHIRVMFSVRVAG